MLSDAKRRQLWAYVHGQLTEDDRQALELQLRDDAELRRELLRTQQLNRFLRDHLAEAVEARAELENRVLEAVEAGGVRAKTPPWWRRRAFAGILAVAALLLVLTGAPLYLRGPVAWEAPQFTPLEYRGDPEPQHGRYTREDAEACFRAFRGALVRAFDEARPPRRTRRPVVAFSVRELPRGRLAIEVAVRYDGDRPPVLSTREVGSVGEFEAAADAMAAEVMVSALVQDAVRQHVRRDGGGSP